MLETVYFTVFLGAFMLFIWYQTNMQIDNDFLFFLRKKQFKQKVVQSGHDSIWSLLDTLLDTTANDWNYYDGGLMAYQPFPQTTILFNDISSLELEIFEGAGEKQVFNLCYYQDEKQILHGYDYLAKRHVTTKDEMRLEQILFHLEQHLHILQTNEQQETPSAQQKEEDPYLQKKQLKKEQLRVVLEDHSRIETTRVQYGFTFERHDEPNHATLLISLEDVLYFQAFHLKKTNEVVTKFHHESEPFAPIFKDLEASLQAFATQQLVLPDVPFSFEEQHQETITTIQTLLAQLEQENMWLSGESYHQVTETFPKDLDALQDVYRVVRAKEQVQDDINQSLTTILRKIEAIAEEAENNKQKEVAKRTYIIEKR